MRDDQSSTAHYQAVISDLKARVTELDLEASELRKMIDRLEAISGAPHPLSVPSENVNAITVGAPVAASMAATAPSAVTHYTGLGLGDACVSAISALGGRATNRDILDHLLAAGYQIKSTNPLNNVGTGLNHRSKNRGDIFREGHFWIVKKSESPGFNGAKNANTRCDGASL